MCVCDCHACSDSWDEVVVQLDGTKTKSSRLEIDMVSTTRRIVFSIRTLSQHTSLWDQTRTVFVLFSKASHF